MISVPLLTAAIFTFVIGVIHSWLGERRLIGPRLSPQRRQGMLADSNYFRQILRATWHLMTLAWWGFGGILGALAISPVNRQARTILVIIALLFLACGLTILITTRGRHLAWPVFLVVACLALVPVL